VDVNEAVASEGESPSGEKVVFATQLKALREAAGLTQRELFSFATHKDASTGTVTAISHWEDGRRIPVPGQLAAMLRVFREHGLGDAICWDLVEAAAVAHHRYAGFLALLEVAPSASPETKQKMFETWAATFPERAERT
jgi:DNA-binding transcriptional regulator YiaG